MSKWDRCIGTSLHRCTAASLHHCWTGKRREAKTVDGEWGVKKGQKGQRKRNDMI